VSSLSNMFDNPTTAKNVGKKSRLTGFSAHTAGRAKSASLAGSAGATAPAMPTSGVRLGQCA